MEEDIGQGWTVGLIDGSERRTVLKSFKADELRPRTFIVTLYVPHWNRTMFIPL